MSGVTAWARVGSDNIVTNVELADDEWVAGWVSDHPDATERYIKSEYGTPRQASIGWAYDPATDAFYPPKPAEDWEWHEDRWVWLPPIPPKPSGNGWEWNEDYWQWRTPRPDGDGWVWHDDTQEWKPAEV